LFASGNMVGTPAKTSEPLSVSWNEWSWMVEIDCANLRAERDQD